jgi:hypothetical protein
MDWLAAKGNNYRKHMFLLGKNRVSRMCSLKSTLAVGCFQGIVEQNNVDISSINPVVTRVINTEAYLGGQT